MMIAPFILTSAEEVCLSVRLQYISKAYYFDDFQMQIFLMIFLLLSKYKYQGNLVYRKT